MTILTTIYKKFNYHTFDRNLALKLNKLIKKHQGMKCIVLIDNHTFSNPIVSLWVWTDRWLRIYDHRISINQKVQYATDIIVLASLYQDALVELIELSLLSQVKLPQNLGIVNLCISPYINNGAFLRQLENLQINFVIKAHITKASLCEDEKLKEEIDNVLESLPFQILELKKI